MKKKLKILFVAMSDSIHTVRWINQIVDQGWDIHLFPAVDYGSSHPGFKNITIHHSFYSKANNPGKGVVLSGRNFSNPFLAQGAIYYYKARRPGYRIKQLVKTIRKIKPDIIHSHEFTLAGYLTLEAKKIMGESFPKWVMTNWGSDIYLFGQLRAHESRIKEVLANCDYYSCECARDVALAREYGFNGKVLPVFPNAGGFDLKKVRHYRAEKTSQRKVILLKGYQNWAGRALAGLRSIARLGKVIDGYKIIIFSTFPGSDVDIAAEIFSKQTGVEAKVVYETTHENILKLHGQARIYLGLGISDAISTSLLEAMVMGAFPIQSNTSCACEWIEDKKSGFLVPPEDPDIIVKALKRALENDQLVDEAAKINWKLAQRKLNREYVKRQTVDFYNQVINK